MDLNNYIVKEYLFIFRSKEYEDHYIIFFESEHFANRYFEQITRSGPKYGILPEDGVPYGYPYFQLEKVLQADANKEFVEYLQNRIAGEKIECKLGDYGWYILKEIDVEKWKALYQTELSKQRRKMLEVGQNDKKGAQIKMF
ncbi:MAG: hypothetical protein M3Z26_12940 [Bacteroidota bacterium]|nr:hypothetical protein [Bacteroidota bacterium]